ncbi:MAG: zf-TFIIB domain-containing protein [Solirubrobacterales bacterium]
MTTTLVCPKCGSEMRSYERNGVTVDQCTGCGGLFLDKGELERLSEAESAFYGGGQQAPAPQQSGGGHQQEYKKKKKSKTSFLQDLFEG